MPFPDRLLRQPPPVRTRPPDDLVAAAAERGINIWRADATTLPISVDEATTSEQTAALLDAFGVPRDRG